ncbi:MAG: hypothetical protein RL329_1872 [Bacteroidota bacterium]|jgi:hypothetical protein
MCDVKAFKEYRVKMNAKILAKVSSIFKEIQNQLL